MGDNPLTEGAPNTVNGTPVLLAPLTITVTVPFEAFDGTVAETLVLVHDEVVAVTPLNCTWLLPYGVVNPVPYKVTCPPGAAAGGSIWSSTGLITVKDTFELLVMEFTATVTGPAPAGAALGTLA